MYLNVIKGPYPGLAQVDKTLPLFAGETAERGTALYVDVESGETVFKRATAAEIGTSVLPGAFIYFALQPDTDLVAGMAGDVGTGAVSAANGQPKITGLACIPSCEIETDMFTVGPVYAVGDLLMVDADGKLTQHTDGSTAIGQVTAVPADRWVNNAVAVTGWRTGNQLSVITFRSLYLPSVAN